MNIIVKGSFLSVILNANNQMLIPQSCPDLAIWLYYFCLVVILRYVQDTRTRYQTFARAEDLKLFIKM